MAATEGSLPTVSISPGFPAQPSAEASRSAVARLLLAALARECGSFCVLTGYDELPERFSSDIDFMVLPSSFPELPLLVHRVAQEAGFSLFQYTPHEVSARAFFLGRLNGAGLTLVQPDATGDYRHYGRLWLHSKEFLASRRWHPNGFWIPGAAYECVYYLIKRLNKRDFAPEHGMRLSRLYAEDPAGADKLLARFWTGRSLEALRTMAVSGDWQSLMDNLAPFRQEMLRHSPEGWFARLASRVREFFADAARMLRPTGAWISFMGPDGCGKSSVIEGVTAAFRPAYRDVVRFHLRPKLLRARTAEGAAVTDPHGKPPYGWLSSLLRAGYLALDYFGGYFVRVRSATIRTKLVIFDRYLYDLVVDPKRIRYGGPRWLLPLLARFVPQPELVFLLNAPPEVLWARKQETSPEELTRQQKAYLALAGRLRNGVVIDATQPLEAVVRDVNQAILERLSKRTSRRLKLPELVPQHGPSVQEQAPANYS